MTKFKGTQKAASRPQSGLTPCGGAQGAGKDGAAYLKTPPPTPVAVCRRHVPAAVVGTAEQADTAPHHTSRPSIHKGPFINVQREHQPHDHCRAAVPDRGVRWRSTGPFIGAAAPSAPRAGRRRRRRSKPLKSNVAHLLGHQINMHASLEWPFPAGSLTHRRHWINSVLVDHLKFCS